MVTVVAFLPSVSQIKAASWFDPLDEMSTAHIMIVAPGCIMYEDRSDLGYIMYYSVRLRF